MICGTAALHRQASTAVQQLVLCVCVCFLPINSGHQDVPAGVTQEEGHTGSIIHLLSAVRALIFFARRIQTFLFLVDREVESSVLELIIYFCFLVF